MSEYFLKENHMIPTVDSTAYMQRLLALPRPGEENILAYYEHRIGLIGTDSKLMLLPMDDHLAHRGDGVFETVKYTGGRLYQLDQHLERMQRSAQGIFLEPPCSWQELREIVLEVAAAGKDKNGQMRILIGRGPGGFGIDPAESPKPSLYVVAYRFVQKPEAWFAKGLSGFRTSIPAKQGYMARVKNANYLPNVLMIREAKERGADVPFCFDEQSYLAESAVANLCLVDQTGTLVVPEFTNALPGTTMLRAMELVKGEVNAVFRQVPEADIFAAKEAMLLGTGPDCVAVVSYEGKPIGTGRPGPVCELLRRRIAEDIVATGVPIRGLA